MAGHGAGDRSNAAPAAATDHGRAFAPTINNKPCVDANLRVSYGFAVNFCRVLIETGDLARVVKLLQRLRALRLSKLSLTTGPLRYVLSMAEQGFASTLNLATNLWLIRHLNPGDYGAFVLTTNAALILCNVQGGMTLAHLMTLPLGDASTATRAQPERMILSMTLLLVTLSGLLTVLALVVFDEQTAVIPLAMALYLPALMLYSYTRSLAFSRGLVLTATVQTCAVLLIAAILIGATVLFGIGQKVDLALLILTLAYGGAAFVTLYRLCGGMFAKLRLHDLLHFGSYARESAWVLVGIGSIELLGRFNSVIVSVWFDTAAVGTLAATSLLLRPIGMVVSSWSLIGRVAMVEKREAEDWPGFVRTVVQSIAGSLAISVPWVAITYLAWPLISTHLFGGRYADDAWIVLLSGISMMVSAALFVLSLGFQSLRRFRLLAWTDLAAAAAAIGVTLIMVMLHFGFAMTVVGMTIGQVLDFVLLGIMLTRILPQSRGIASRLVPIKD
jgi:O-antigen/teichoic acid export membrane protein